jgi:hypothetical protein
MSSTKMSGKSSKRIIGMKPRYIDPSKCYESEAVLGEGDARPPSPRLPGRSQHHEVPTYRRALT